MLVVWPFSYRATIYTDSKHLQTSMKTGKNGPVILNDRTKYLTAIQKIFLRL